MRKPKLRFSIRSLLVLFLFVSVILVFVSNGIRSQRYETTMTVSISYPGTNNNVRRSLAFDNAFWTEVCRDPDVQDLLAIEKPLDANAWMKSHFSVCALKNSEVLRLTVHRHRYGDVGSLEEYPDLLEAIVAELREQAESEGATVDVLQSPSMPIKGSFFTLR